MNVLTGVIHWIRRKLIWIIGKVSEDVTPDAVNVQLVAAQRILVEQENHENRSFTEEESSVRVDNDENKESTVESETNNPAILNSDEDPELKKDVENEHVEKQSVVTTVDDEQQIVEKPSTITVLEEILIATVVEDVPKQMEEVFTSTVAAVEDEQQIDQIDEPFTSNELGADDNVDKFRDESSQKSTIVLQDMLMSESKIVSDAQKLDHVSMEEMNTVHITLDEFVENYHSSEDESFDIEKAEAELLFETSKGKGAPQESDDENVFPKKTDKKKEKIDERDNRPASIHKIM